MNICIEVQPVQIAPSKKTTGLCGICSNTAPPVMAYEINMAGWAIIILLTLCTGFCGLIACCVICGEKKEADGCHDPVAKCASCGAVRMG